MKLATVTLSFFLALGIFSVAAQNINDREATPKEIVEQLWSMATRGDLLNLTGWTQASGLFTQPVPPPGNKVVLVMSNHYGVVQVSIKENSANVSMACTKLGQLDSELRFTPAPATNVYQTGLGYHLVTGHRHIIMYDHDGKTKLQDKEIPESIIWQIEGSQGQPWTTVNTAIRYVLEQKAKATDPAVKQNADRTLAKLMALH